MKALLAALLIGVTNCHAATFCPTTPRMSYQQSSAIKRSLIPAGHSASEYELDHIVPLCMGGSNDRGNLQLQTWADADMKDRDEVSLCDLVRDGVLTCDEAQETMRNWKPGE